MQNVMEKDFSTGFNMLKGVCEKVKRHNVTGKYPCRNCIVLSCCTQECYKIKKRNRDATSKLLMSGICPDCGQEITHQRTLSVEYYISCHNCGHKFLMVGNWFKSRVL